MTRSAFSAIIAVMVLAFGFQLTFGEYFWYFLAGIAIAVPRTNKGRICSFLTTSFVSLMLCPSYLFLSSYVLWMGPLAVVHCATDSFSKKKQCFFRYICFLSGMLIVLWTTPMLFVQLSLVSRPIAFLIMILAVCADIPLSRLYARLFENVRRMVNERILHIS